MIKSDKQICFCKIPPKKPKEQEPTFNFLLLNACNNYISCNPSPRKTMILPVDTAPK